MFRPWSNRLSNNRLHRNPYIALWILANSKKKSAMKISRLLILEMLYLVSDADAFWMRSRPCELGPFRVRLGPGDPFWTRLGAILGT